MTSVSLDELFDSSLEPIEFEKKIVEIKKIDNDVETIDGFCANTLRNNLMRSISEDKYEDARNHFNRIATDTNNTEHVFYSIRTTLDDNIYLEFVTERKDGLIVQYTRLRDYKNNIIYII